MWITALIFIGAGLWFFPLTAVIFFDGGWRLFWLPRVWCGYAAARRLSLGRKERQGRTLLGRVPAVFSLILGRQLISRLELGRVSFCFTPAGSRFYCIAGITLGHIIISMARAALIYTKRRKLWKRRLPWPLNMR